MSCTEKVVFNTIDEGDISISMDGPFSPYDFEYVIDNSTGFVTGETGYSFNIQFKFLSSLHGSGQDIITVTFHDDTVIQDIDGNTLLTRTMQTEVYNYYPVVSEQEKAEASSRSYASLVTLILTFATSYSIQLILGGTIEATWLLLGTLQLMSFLPLLSLHLPSNFREFSKNLAVLNGEPQSFPNIFEYYYDTLDIDKEPFTQYFELMNFKTSHLLLNAGRKAMIWIVLGMLMCLSWLIVDFFRPSDKFCKILVKIDTKLRYGMIIRAISQSYISLALSACLNAYTISWKGNISVMNNIISLIVAVVMIYIPTFTYTIIQNTYNLNDAMFQKRFKIFIIDLKTDDPLCFHFTTVFLFRRAVYACCFVIFAFSSKTQISLILSIVILMMLYLLIVTPYKSILSKVL